MSHYFVGVDGGGTHTRALVTDVNLRELGRAEGPASLADPSAPEASAAVIERVVRTALERVGAPTPITALWAGIAGVGREAVRTAVEGALQRSGIATHVGVGTDVEAAFEDAFDGGAGILVVAGTGSIGWGRSESGVVGRVGGWGSLVGDEGSGYAIGIEALKRVARDVDGRGEQTRLEEEILEELGLPSAEELIPWASGATKAQIAALVHVVSRCAKGGDAIAGEVLVHAVEQLEGHALTLLNTLGPWSARPRVALSGGLLEPGGILRAGMESALRQHHIQLVARRLDPVRGAAKRAERLRDEAG